MARHMYSLIGFLFLGITGVIFCAGDTASPDEIRAQDQASWDAEYEELKYKFCLKSLRLTKDELSFYSVSSGQARAEAERMFLRMDELYKQVDDEYRSGKEIDFSKKLMTRRGHLLFCNEPMAREVQVLTSKLGRWVETVKTSP